MAAESISLSVPVPNADFFDNSPLHTPSKVLKNLDLLSANGDFVKNSDYNDPSSAVSSPCLRRRRFSTHRTPDMRRRSFNSNTGVNYEQTICDEFSHINLTIKDRERRLSSAATSHESLADTPTKRFVCTKKVNESNQIVIAKILDEAGDEDETIEIIDLDEDEKVESSARSRERNLYPNCDVNVWLRSCEKEIIEPVEGSVSGDIPSWINGSLLRYECSTLHRHDSSIEYFMCFSLTLFWQKWTRQPQSWQLNLQSSFRRGRSSSSFQHHKWSRHLSKSFPHERFVSQKLGSEPYRRFGVCNGGERARSLSEHFREVKLYIIDATVGVCRPFHEFPNFNFAGLPCCFDQLRTIQIMR